MAVSTDKRAIVDRVRACLNRAGGTTFDGEREAAVAAAKRLVAKYSLDAYDVGPLAHMVGLRTPPTADADFKRLIDEAMRAASRTYTSPFGSRQARQQRSRAEQDAYERQAHQGEERRRTRANARTAAGGRPYRATWREGDARMAASFATEENAWKWARKQGDRIQGFKVRVAA